MVRKECINMEEKMVRIVNAMAEFLSIEQLKKLQEVIVQELSENEPQRENISNDEYITRFLNAKQMEGCSDRTIQYYRVTVEHFLKDNGGLFDTEQLEDAMQTVMDTYAGGIGTNYRFHEKELDIADEKIVRLMELSDQLHAADYQELMYIYELRERLVVCRSVIAHLKARKETRWHSFAENLDHPEKDDLHWRRYVNSRMRDGKLEIVFRELVEEGQNYEHCH